MSLDGCRLDRSKPLRRDAGPAREIVDRQAAFVPQAPEVAREQLRCRQWF